MNKINITLIIVSLLLGMWVFTLQRKVTEQGKYWQVMINNSPKEVQDFFYAEVKKLK